MGLSSTVSWSGSQKQRVLKRSVQGLQYVEISHPSLSCYIKVGGGVRTRVSMATPCAANALLGGDVLASITTL